ncbi:MAG: type II toxin-antitoxin system Phd/YefM family antitoxin [Rhodospirillales bacterium]|nr:type II toxin-antitoxin system Phd/YefM family antitoxin [Rhodospirillales bacterium]
MLKVNMLEAKTALSALVAAIEEGRESEVIIARNGRPAARLVPLAAPRDGERIGVARGAFVVPEDIDADNRMIATLFRGGDD